MKKLVLKGWVITVLTIINVLALFVLASDHENLGVFLITHIMAMIVFGFNSILIIRFGNKKYFE